MEQVGNAGPRVAHLDDRLVGLELDDQVALPLFRPAVR